MDDATLAEREHLVYLNSFDVIADSVPNGSNQWTQSGH